MDVNVVTKQTEEGYSAWVPGLPGCWSEGATEAEAFDNITDAITNYLMVAAELSRREVGSKVHRVHLDVA